MELCAFRSIKLRPHQIPGKLNVLADALSRNAWIPGEWKLNPVDGKKILAQFPLIQADLMATPIQCYCREFGFSFSTPSSDGAGCLVPGLEHLSFLYLFPPQSQVAQVFNCLQTCRGKCSWSSRITTCSFLHSLIKYCTGSFPRSSPQAEGEGP